MRILNKHRKPQPTQRINKHVIATKILLFVAFIWYNLFMKECEFVSHSVSQTENFAEQLACQFSGGEVIILRGDLGAGKTHFVKGLAKGLGVDEVITSPTFALHNAYSGRLTLNHFDFYRIIDSEEVAVLGLNEFFYDKHAVAAIEWSENIKDLLPRNCICVTIDKLDDVTRRITIKPN